LGSAVATEQATMMPRPAKRFFISVSLPVEFGYGVRGLADTATGSR